jgi:hypothetical protein
MLLERGRVVTIADPGVVARRYREINFGHLVHEPPTERDSSPALASASILGAWFEDQQGQRIQAIEHGTPCVACVEVCVNAPLDEPIFGMTIRNDAGHTVFATTSQFADFSVGRLAPGDNIVVRMPFENWLTPSRYVLTPSIARNGTGDDTLDMWEDAAELLVHGGRFTGAVVNLPHQFQLERR